ncbi:MlaD family protein [Nocardia pseudobrasiliensis]|uniref:Phospholipid/cholesterol/gamma-HCH transport system substrate-binding protein n=1 Tax=Nocardia pseudobrasiliensis TaxID=45979 RepID=A0A370ICA5_9NOCA|nr:MlaD family protein [Nocardia pseudobrasiliensis]RDI68372.1 phospholipid/cholesterol/gamma-HCH transport system substrate-binding protein [Nocardia pseudobrasiliensis]
MTTTRQALWRLAVAAAVTVVLFVGVVNALRNPVQSQTASYTADFTDVSGLKVGADVRRHGVQAGKVTTIDIRHQGGRNIAEIGFTLDRAQQVTTDTRLAVKYQNLSGLRYIDITDQASADTRPLRHVPLTQTTGSFDITALFNGLEPVLRALDPAQVNTLAANLAAFLDDDGTGPADLAANIRAIADYTADRQHTIATLVGNLATLARTMNGKSARVLEFITNFDPVIDRTMTVLDQFYATAQYGPSFVAAVNRLLTAVGLHENTDLDALLRAALSTMTNAPEVLRLLPPMLAGLQQLTAAPNVDTHCGNGIAPLPSTVQVLLAGQRVVLCRR